jgi:RNase H-fold protein (predicted Holliday junction resolvase)
MASMREKRNVCTILVGKPKAMRSLERTRVRWEDKIKRNSN